MSKISHNSAIMFFAFTGVLAPHRRHHETETPESFDSTMPWDPRCLPKGPDGAPPATDGRSASDCGSVWLGALPTVDRS
jgi:hypothetical protein